jgi:hypothetical protein
MMAGVYGSDARTSHRRLHCEGVNADLVSTGRVDVDLQLDPLTRPDQRGPSGVAASLEKAQEVYRDRPQMLSTCW